MAQLYDILLTAGVQETFADKLRDDGWTTELYAMCATHQENFKEELTEMLGTSYAVTTPIQRDIGMASMPPERRSACSVVFQSAIGSC